VQGIIVQVLGQAGPLLFLRRDELTDEPPPVLVHPTQRREARVELAHPVLELGSQESVLDHRRRHLGHLDEHRLVLGRELTAPLVGGVDEAEVGSIPPDQRGGQPAVQRRMVGRLRSGAEERVMGLQLFLDEPHRPVALAHQPVDAGAAGRRAIAARGRESLGHRQDVTACPQSPSIVWLVTAMSAPTRSRARSVTS